MLWHIFRRFYGILVGWSIFISTYNVFDFFFFADVSDDAIDSKLYVVFGWSVVQSIRRCR